MKKLVRCPRYFLALGICLMVVQVVLSVSLPQEWKLYAIVSLPLVLATAILIFKASMDLKAARLITENQILHIQPAVFLEQNGQVKGTLSKGESIEVFVSCFGILLDSKIVKFNQKGIHLREVVLGRDFITLTYCVKQRVNTISLLHGAIDDAALETISQKFRYETGISPVVKI